jgi:hypothetical protein
MKSGQTLLRSFVWLFLLSALAAPGASRAEAVCPPDGDDTLWPTFDTEDICGNYHDCTNLVLNNEIAASKACMQKLEDCAVALTKANTRADAHNSALEVCRAKIPARKAAVPKSSGALPHNFADGNSCNRACWPLSSDQS